MARKKKVPSAPSAAERERLAKALKADADACPEPQAQAEVPEYTRVRFGARRGKYHTSTGPAWPGAEVSLPWAEALVYIDRGEAEEVSSAG